MESDRGVPEGVQPVPAGAAIVWLWAAADLEPPRAARGPGPRPIGRHVVLPDSHVVVGRRGSVDEPVVGDDGDGALRLALPQEHRLTSRRHVRLERRGQWSLEVASAAAPSAGVRAWGRLRWDPAEPGARYPLSAGRPVAMLLAGSPAYVLTVEAVASAKSRIPTATGTKSDIEAHVVELKDGGVPVQAGQSQRTDIDTLQAPVTLSDQAVFSLVRIFRAALQWPPHPHDDPTPSWTGMPQDEALRASYRRLRGIALEPLRLPRDRGPDPELLLRLIATGCLTWERVRGVADACDLPFPPRRLSSPGFSDGC